MKFFRLYKPDTHNENAHWKRNFLEPCQSFAFPRKTNECSSHHEKLLQVTLAPTRRHSRTHLARCIYCLVVDQKTHLGFPWALFDLIRTIVTTMTREIIPNLFFCASLAVFHAFHALVELLNFYKKMCLLERGDRILLGLGKGWEVWCKVCKKFPLL